MICRNCGREVNDLNRLCPGCGASVVPENTEYYSQNYNQSYSQGYSQNSQPIKITGLLVWSIIELVCLSPIFGLVALILWITKLKPAVESGNTNEALKAKRTIKILLWIGIALGIIPLILIFLIAIPNFSGINTRMQVRADISTAAQIGKSTRIWYVEALSDPSIDVNYEEVEKGFVKLDEIEGLEEYMFATEPTSYRNRRGNLVENQSYYVTIINEDEPTESKIVVAIASESDNLNRIYRNEDDIDTANYDGTEAGIAYIEP